MKRHPNLRKKFNILYNLRLNPEIKSNADLASRLGISRQAVTKWVRGTDTTPGDCIPFGQIDKVSALFDISDQLFTLPLHEFEDKVRDIAGMRKGKKLNQDTNVFISMLPSTTASVLGRSKEIQTLDAALIGPDITTLQIVAFGGVGKSTLVNYWLSRITSGGVPGVSRVYAWSFYEYRSTSEVSTNSDHFIEHALEWFGDPDPFTGSPWSKASRLAKLIRAEKTILVLDGLESMQAPPGRHYGQIKDAALALLVKELALHNSGLMIITSRLDSPELSCYGDERVATINLANLGDNEGIKLLKNMNLKGRTKDFKAVVKQYKGHPLSLNLLGGYFAIVNDGLVTSCQHLPVIFSTSNEINDVKGVMLLYLQWFENRVELTILYLISLIRKTITLGELRRILIPEVLPDKLADIASLSTVEWKFAIENLKVAGLISVSRINYDLEIDSHPLIKDFMDSHLKEQLPQIWKATNGSIFNYLVNKIHSESLPIGESDLLFRAVIHGANAGLHQQAFDLYYLKLKNKFTMIQSGSQYKDESCIKCFFEEGLTRPVEELNEPSKMRLMSSLATNSMALGKLDDACKYAEDAIGSFINKGYWVEAISTVGPYLSMLLVSGGIEEFFSVLREVQQCICKTNNPVVKAVSQCFHAHALHLSGEDEKAKSMFLEAEEILQLKHPPAPVNFPTISSFYCKYLLDNGKAESALDRSLRTFTWRRHNTWQVSVDTTSLLATDMQMLGLAFLELGETDRAKGYLEKQVELFQEADEWLYLPSGLIARAKLYLKIDQLDDAEADLIEAVDSAQRSGAKTSQLEALLELAKFKLTQGDKKVAAKYFSEAKNIPGMEGYKLFDSKIDELRIFFKKYPHQKPGDNEGPEPRPDN